MHENPLSNTRQAFYLHTKSNRHTRTHAHTHIPPAGRPAIRSLHTPTAPSWMTSGMVANRISVAARYAAV